MKILKYTLVQLDDRRGDMVASSTSLVDNVACLGVSLDSTWIPLPTGWEGRVAEKQARRARKCARGARVMRRVGGEVSRNQPAVINSHGSAGGHTKGGPSRTRGLSTRNRGSYAREEACAAAAATDDNSPIFQGSLSAPRGRVRRVGCLMRGEAHTAAVKPLAPA